MSDDLILGIEVGGTKLQFGVGRPGSGEFIAFRRLFVDRQRGAEAIREGILHAGSELLAAHDVHGISYGFGGPVDAATGAVVTSHQVDGWDGFPLRAWTQERLQRPTTVGNDCDVAALGEARLGAGRGSETVFYVTVGTGIGGGLVIAGARHGRNRPAVAEIGHLRPGPKSREACNTVESIASGPGIEAAARKLLSESETGSRDLLAACDGRPAELTTQQIAAAAASGNPLALRVLDNAMRTLGWAVAQVVTLVAPDVVVLGGGVSLMLESLFLQPVRAAVDEYVFPPLRGAFRVVPAALGEEVVVHGAIANATPSESV